MRFIDQNNEEYKISVEKTGIGILTIGRGRNIDEQGPCDISIPHSEGSYWETFKSLIKRTHEGETVEYVGKEAKAQPYTTVSREHVTFNTQTRTIHPITTNNITMVDDKILEYGESVRLEDGTKLRLGLLKLTYYED